MDRLDTGIIGGDDWREEIQNALTPRRCSGMLAILSPEYLNSSMCRKELARADRLGIRIYPIIACYVKDEQWPIEIERSQYIDFVNRDNEIEYQKKFDALLVTIRKEFPSQFAELPDPETRYLTSIIADLKIQQGVNEFIDLTLEGIEIKSQIKPKGDDDMGYSLLLDEKIDLPEITIIEFNKVSDVILEYPKFVLVGSPGAGKTTIIRRLALEIAHKRLKEPKTSKIPLIALLPQWQDELTFDEFIKSKWPLNTNPMQLIEFGEIFLLLDGLNEMGAGNLSKISRLSDWLSTTSNLSNVIISCRAEDYIEAIRFRNLPTVEIKELSDNQIKQFVSSYLKENADGLLQLIFPKPKDITEIVDKSSKMLSGEISIKPKRQELHFLARNPYFLSAFIIIYSNAPNEELPKNSGTLSRGLVKALWKREQSRNQFTQDFGNVELEFARLAFAMIDSDMPVDVSREYALLFLGSEEILRMGKNANYLTININNVRFYHQLIQEYFAAIGLSRVGLNHIKLEKKPLKQRSTYRNNYDFGSLFESNL